MSFSRIASFGIVALCAACLPRAASAPTPPAPALDSPKCIRVPEARGERPGDEELAVGRNGESCAYPLRMMTYHRIVNDHLGGPPILVVYDPDRGAGRVFDPVIDRKAYTFDVAPPQQGLPAVQDRETKSLWSAITGKALAGPMAGKQMAVTPSLIITWERWGQLHPDSYVLAEDPRQSRHYVMRCTPAAFALPADLLQKGDRRLPADTLVLGVDAGSWRIAFLPDAKGGRGRVEGPRQDIWILRDPEAHAVSAYRLVTTKGIRLNTLASGGAANPARGFTDTPTGSIWSIEGRCIDGKLKGEALAAVPALRLRWYAWSALYPQTVLIQ